MTGLMERYIELLDETSPFDSLTLFRPKDELPETIKSRESLKSHIRSLLKKVGLVFKRPSTVDLDRVHIYDSLVKYWHDPKIKALIRSVDSRLLFNGDETSVCRILDSSEKVVCEPDEHPIAPSQQRKGKHITLFPIISASNEVVKPYVLLHCEREDFVDKSIYPFQTYRTENGYMDNNTFTKAECLTFPVMHFSSPITFIIINYHTNTYCFPLTILLKTSF